MAEKRGSKLTYGAPPRVNLLPSAQRAALRHERMMPKLLLAIVLSAVVAGLIWAVGTLPVAAADARLADAEAESNELITQIAAHADTQQTLSVVNKLVNAREELTNGEILYIEVLDEIDDALPAGVTIEQYTGQLVDPDADDSESGAQAGGEFSIDLNPLCVPENATITVMFVGDDLGPAPTFIRNLETDVSGILCIVGTKIYQEDPESPQEVTVQFALGEEALAERFGEEAE